MTDLEYVQDLFVAGNCEMRQSTHVRQIMNGMTHGTARRLPPSFPRMTMKLLPGPTQESGQACTTMCWKWDISVCVSMELTVHLHWFAGKRVDDLVGVKVLLTVRIFLK